MADFPSPTLEDRDEFMDLEGLEGATTASPPSSSTTMVPSPSSSTTSVPAKKKISIQEYNCRKAAEQQRASTYLDRDENREDLDYEDFQPQDDPANIQIGYQTPTPIPQIPDLPPLQDASNLASQAATTPVAPNVTIPMPQGNTSPGTILGTTAHNVALQLTKPLALARDCQWPELHPCRSGPRHLQLHQCRLVHQQPCCIGCPDMGSLQRKHFYKGPPYHTLPGKRLTF